MSEDDPALPARSTDHNQAGPFPENDVQSVAVGQSPAWRKLRMILLGGLILSGSGLLFAGLLTGASAWYTSRSEFCVSCHIMEPYYQSWEQSSHADVACIKCHFPPGAAEKVRGKMLGLVQLATYVTRSQGPRPVAEVPDASCLRSGCHETRTLAGRVDFHGISFDHTPHLENLRRGKKLRCTSCHSQIVQGTHMTVTTSTCFLCHFKDGLFNEGLGACTRCHQIPEETFELGGDVTFSHELAYEKGVDCQNCHGDLIRGKGEVSHNVCRSCHNREINFEKLSDDKLMHDIHVTDHKIECLDCHGEIEHSLEPEKLLHAASDCKSCHPDHHHEQVNMLLGVGGMSIPDRSTSMLNTRVECRACHRVKEVSPTGTVVWKASADGCITCHNSAAVEELKDYHQQVTAALLDLEATLERIRTAVDLADLESAQLSAINDTLARLQHDVDFLNSANGIHNIHYASSLTRVVLEDLKVLCRDLEIPEPTATLPDDIENFE